MRLRNIPKMNYRLYQLYERTMATLNPPKPNPPFSVLNLELTTRCNSRCSFCAHQQIIGSGIRPSKDMSLEMAKKCIDWYAKLGKETVLKFVPVGLGEPLLYPHLIEVMTYAKKVFPNCQTYANTNGIALKGELADELIDNALDGLTLSLCFVDGADYAKKMRTEQYDAVVKNMRSFLLAKGNCKPACVVHVFDIPENKSKLGRWVRGWGPYLNKNDRLSIYHYVELLATHERLITKWPCSEVDGFYGIIIDVDGYVYPCCSSLWKEEYKELRLSDLTKDPQELPSKLREFRKEFPPRPCHHCAILEVKR